MSVISIILPDGAPPKRLVGGLLFLFSIASYALWDGIVAKKNRFYVRRRHPYVNV